MLSGAILRHRVIRQPSERICMETSTENGASCDNAKVRVVLFSGGRGSRVLSKHLINHPQVKLTLAINGYDDGLSTGEVRRFLGDSLGPSDFRKNASRLAGELQTCRPGLIEALDLRFPLNYTAPEALASFRVVSDIAARVESEFPAKLQALIAELDGDARQALACRLNLFERELERKGFDFSFNDCSIGNLIFAGCFLKVGRNFNAAIADYCMLLNLPSDLIENVTDGTNAFLVALDHDQRLLASEADIVDAKRRNHIKDIYLIDRPLAEDEQRRLANAPVNEALDFLERRSYVPMINPRILDRIAEADLIIYSPGTQHSSLLPSYITPGLGAAIAQNLKAIKLLITNILEDSEIPDSSALDLIRKAAYYLKEKDTRNIPTPCLITHYLINNPHKSSEEVPYIPLGRLESLEDPRLVRIGNYEEGSTGHHDASKVLAPFIRSILQHGGVRKIAILLLETTSLDKISQTMIEMVRGGIRDSGSDVTVFFQSEEYFATSFIASLPFKVYQVPTKVGGVEVSMLKTIEVRQFDYAILFDSSGMYKGEDIVNLATLLNQPRLDAVWGSRRLSVKDIHQSYKLRYHDNHVVGAFSRWGSHMLSLAYLILYGRYISDTLSGARAIRISYLNAAEIDLKHQCANQHLLSRLLNDDAELFETPVQFFPMSPERVRRPTIFGGVRALFTILWERLKPRKQSRDLAVTNACGERVVGVSQ
jgi:2-phospho-L-lactate transferase/gluconeogenesis factor (CofD/UPF0052 family)